MKLSRQQLRRLILEVTGNDDDDTLEDDDPIRRMGFEDYQDSTDYLTKIKSMLAGDPSMDNIIQASELADMAGVDMAAFRDIVHPVIVNSVKSSERMTIDDVKDLHELAKSIGFELDKLQTLVHPAMLKAANSYTKPNLNDIKTIHDFAKSLNLDRGQIGSVILTMVKKANLLENTAVDNVIYEIDDILYNITDMGLQSLGLNSLDDYQDSGGITEEEVNDIRMELGHSVRNEAYVAIERAIQQVIALTMKIK